MAYVTINAPARALSLFAGSYIVRGNEARRERLNRRIRRARLRASLRGRLKAMSTSSLLNRVDNGRQ